jgi:hypothetical protein
VAIRIEPYIDAHAPAARAFNARIGDTSPFGLAEHAPLLESADSPIRHHHFLALDGLEIRGGFLMASFPGWFGNREAAPFWNCREPLSEGIVDQKYALLAIRMLKHIQQQSPYVFALGMGGEQLPFPRLLRGAGWIVRPVPFLFRVFSPARFARELALFQRGPLHPIARAAASTGAAALGLAALQVRSLTASRRGCTIEKVDAWGAWADEIWEGFRSTCSACVARDRKTLTALYPLEDGRIAGHLVRRNGRAVAWCATMSTPMRGHKYFGNLRVGTILDCAALPEGLSPAIALSTSMLAREGADLVVTNQSHARIVKAFRQSGFLSARSNYILAMSKGLSEAVASQTDGASRLHFTRGDSDGRIHL